MNEHQRLHQSSEQAKAASEKARHDVSLHLFVLGERTLTFQHHANEAEREQKLASLHAQSETKTGLAAPAGADQTAAPVAAAPVAGAPLATGHHDAGYAQQPIVGQQQAVGGVPQQTTAVHPQGYTGAQPTEGQQIAGAVRHM